MIKIELHQHIHSLRADIKFDYYYRHRHEKPTEHNTTMIDNIYKSSD